MARRFFVQAAALSAGLLLASGLVQAWFSYQEARAQVAALQALQARAAAVEIEQFLRNIGRGLAAVQALPWGQAGFEAAQRRFELQRLLPLNPALTQLTDLDAQGRELIQVSRTQPDRLNPAAASAPAVTTQPFKPGYSAPQFDDSGEPTVQVVSERKGLPAGHTVATINLRFLADVVSGLRMGNGGTVYVVDGSNQLIAHPDAAQVLRQRKLGQPGDGVATVRAALARGAGRLEAVAVTGLDGEPALATAVSLQDTGWLLFVEVPSATALQPVWATLQRTALLLLLGVGLAMGSSAAFGRRMAAPIARLREATAAIAQGRRGERIHLSTGDELQELAGDFNTMMVKLERSYAQLEAKVVQRTAEAVNGREEAERANAAKTRFLASASHDLRQPMHAIGLWVGLLRESLATAQPQQLAELTAKVYAAVRSMDAMFTGLLDISRLDAGATRPQPRPMALAEAVQPAVALSQPLAQAKGLQLRLRGAAAGSALAVNSDPLLLERVVSNLLNNAIRYTQAGGVLVAMRRRGNEAWVRVFDTGVGIAQAQQEEIFEEFVRLGREQRAQTPADEGLGLGLAIVRRTAALLGARVWLRSRPGRGSVFTVALPLSAMLAVATPAATVEPANLAGTFALVVDNDERNLQACAGLLRAWGCHVATAASAQAAVEECEKHLRSPEVIVTDLRLGLGADGIELIRQVRNLVGSWVPALLVTAETQLEREPDGDVTVLQKPVADTALRAALAQALAGKEVS